MGDITRVLNCFDRILVKAKELGFEELESFVEVEKSIAKSLIERSSSTEVLREESWKKI